MNNTQKALKNQDICEEAPSNLGITQSSGLEKHDIIPAMPKRKHSLYDASRLSLQGQPAFCRYH